MKKEAIIAVVLGITFGAVVGVVMLLNTTRQTTTQEIDSIIATESSIVPSEIISGTDFQPLEIVGPEEGIVVSKDSIQVSGKISVNSLVVIQTPATTEIFNADSVDFSKEISLALGENLVKITAYPENSKQNPQQKELRIFYLP